ncbi:hypothetical protein HMPREF9969_1856 [Prevotella sp. oral taxon 306 str. F0472]|nr:hypothetical protein HMPREF9969_1856 [Prevotella sp. oral taxon 306 str. F0472]
MSLLLSLKMQKCLTAIAMDLKKRGSLHSKERLFFMQRNALFK